MSVVVKTEFGEIVIAKEVIGTITGVAATECYGVVGMASRNIKDGITELLRKENFSKGIEVKGTNGEAEIDLHIIVSYGTKISEVSQNVQNRVKYALETHLGFSVSAINIYVQGVRVIKP